jgi:hypothetical protein
VRGCRQRVGNSLRSAQPTRPPCGRVTTGALDCSAGADDSGSRAHNRRIGGAPPWHEGSLDASLVASHGGYSRLPPWTGLGSGWQPAFDRKPAMQPRRVHEVVLEARYCGVGRCCAGEGWCLDDGPFETRSGSGSVQAGRSSTATRDSSCRSATIPHCTRHRKRVRCGGRLGSVKGGSIGVLRECGGGAGMFRTGLVDGVELALMSLVLAVAVRAAHGLHPVSLPGPGCPGPGQLPGQARPGR